MKSLLGAKVCLLPTAETCIANSQCVPPLVCGSDQKCRNGCLADTDCATATAKCMLPEGVCAEPSAFRLTPVTDAATPPVIACMAHDGVCPPGCNATTDPDCPPLCGNFWVELGETCDPPSTCVSGCNDDNACTIDLLTGSAAKCNAACTHVNIAVCTTGDGCCPPGCNANTDADCSPLCGDLFVQSKETCDPPASCPSDCNDANACTVDLLTGSAANCNAACLHTPITSCVSGDGCCPAACNAINDKDCPAVCGNNRVEPGETCDPPSVCAASCNDGNRCTNDVVTGDPASCNVVCSHSKIVACTSGDGCCPEGCDSNTDSECSTTCGNKSVEQNETCDPPESCPTTCDDGKACTIDLLTGSAKNCNVACSHVTISACVGGDGCCPEGCNASNDSECPVKCGNGVVEPGETCDLPSTCPTTCSDGDACTVDSPNGSAANCNVVCIHAPVEACGAKDGCCPLGCNANTDPDCKPRCGNGTLESGETCDPPGSCRTSCTDGNTCTLDLLLGTPGNCDVTCSHREITACSAGDKCCPAACDANSDADCEPKCGNGVPEAGETCDPQWKCPASCDDGKACTTDTMSGTAATCNVVCTHAPISACGALEGCCPAGCNETSDKDCAPVCGNSVVESGETCDPSTSCPTSCDDADYCTVDRSTGSAANCNLACQHIPVLTCANGDKCCVPGCNANNDNDCPSKCGNRVVEPGETCDPKESCPTTCNDSKACTIDTMSGSSETCDVVCTHTTINTCIGGDGCCPVGCNRNTDSDCIPVCGNGVLEPGETCDPKDTCPTSCDDDNICTTDKMLGSAATCNVTCSHVRKGGSCYCLYYFRDLDADGHGNRDVMKCSADQTPPAGWVVSDDDCCDSDANAKPGQTAYYTQPRTGCGGFDYNCNKIEEEQYSAVVRDECGSCPYDTGTSDPWCGTMPECGETGTRFVGCVSNADAGVDAAADCPSCTPRVQACH